jgi:hypothetical protein
MRRLTAPSLSAAALLLSTPALADHPIAGGGVAGSGPIVTLGAETLPRGAVAAGIEASLVKPDAYTDAGLVALAGQHVHAHTTDYNASAGASLAYGLPGHVMVSAHLPFIRRDDLRAGEHSHSGGVTSNTVEQLGLVSGIGDLSLTAQYQVAHDHAAGWFVGLLAGLKVPTGSTHRTAPSGERLETEHQPGTGSWDPLFGIAASKSWGTWALHASALYQLSTEGAQTTELGDRMNLSLAAVYNLPNGASEHAHDGGSEHHSHAPEPQWGLMLEATHEWEGRQTIDGLVEADRGSEVLWLSPGIRYTAPQGWSAGFSAGVPLWQEVGASHLENSFRVTATVGTSF